MHFNLFTLAPRFTLWGLILSFRLCLSFLFLFACFGFAWISGLRNWLSIFGFRLFLLRVYVWVIESACLAFLENGEIQ